TQFNSFVFQQGVYQLQLIGFGFSPVAAGQSGDIRLTVLPGGSITVNRNMWQTQPDPTGDIFIVPDTLIVNVRTSNSILQLACEGGDVVLTTTPGGGKGLPPPPEPEAACNLVITRMQ